ncbi:endolysin [Pseudanabaena phage Pam5]|nr:endolysin [Pseudanabaena phage Pam5]
MDKAAFFAAIRRDLFDGVLAPHQVKRIEVLLDAMIAAEWPLAYASYALATAHHETAQWKHMKELGGESYFRRMYDRAGSRPKVAAALGNTEPGDGVKFAGRGYVQLTGRANYVKAGRALGLDLVKEPDLVEEPETAARVLIWGMSTGAYTGKANRDYLAKSPPDYVNARRIINGTDKASMIAGYAKLFQAALVGAGYGKAAAPAANPTHLYPMAEPVQYPYTSAPAAPAVHTRNNGKFEAPNSEASWWGSMINRLIGREP